MQRVDAQIDHRGIFGRRLSGKSYLGRELIRSDYAASGWRSIVLAPMSKPGDWPGDWAWWTKDRDAWLRTIWKSWACNVVCDDASMTVQRDRSLEELFTCVGHRSHRLIVMGHSGSNLLPSMREQLTEVFLFRQSRKEAEIWAELFSDERIMEACDLDYSAHEFLHAKLGCPPGRHILGRRTEAPRIVPPGRASPRPPGNVRR